MRTSEWVDLRASDRRDELLRIIRDVGYLSATEAARQLGVDSSTIRRDLMRLDQLGLIQRSHGGAVARRDEADVPYDIKIHKRVPQKQAIGAAVAAMVPPGATVMLDSGSTTLMVARALVDHPDLTVVTPDILVAAELITRPNVRLMVPGGEGVRDTTTVVSQESVEMVRRYHVDFAVMASDAVDETGATNMNGVVVPLKRAMMDGAARCVLVADSSKLGQRRLVRVAALEEFAELITDHGVDEATVRAYPVPVRRVSAGTGTEAG
jgi:DeoR/GlpR family transcriptional regulator of sugar metabolism